MDFLHSLVERRITEAAAGGDFDDLPGRGRPLFLEEKPLVPEELRVILRVMRNAGLVPPAVENLRELAALKVLLSEPAEPELKQRALRRLQLLELQLACDGPRGRLEMDPGYREKVLGRLG